MSKDDARLILRAKEGDPAAFGEIYERHQPAIYRYIYYQVGNEAIAEDLTGDVFVRLVEKIDRFRYRGRPILAWLYTIARNLVTDHHRKAGRVISSVPFDERYMAATSDLEEVIDDRFTHRQLAAAIMRLTTNQRQVIILRFIEGQDNRTVAQLVGKSVGAVKALQHRGLASLRRILDEEET